MTINNQKNGTQGGTIHQNAPKTQRCPIKGLARRVHHIISHANGLPDDIISTYFTKTFIQHYNSSQDSSQSNWPCGARLPANVRQLSLPTSWGSNGNAPQQNRLRHHSKNGTLVL